MTWVAGTTSAGRVYAVVLSPRLPKGGRAIYRDSGFVKAFTIGGTQTENLRSVLGASMSRAAPSDWVLQGGFQKNTSIGVSDELVAVMDNATSHIDLYAPDGTPLAVLDLGMPLPRVTDADVEEYLEHARANVGDNIFKQAREAFRWDSTHAIAAGISVEGDALWVRLQARTYVAHRPWVRIAMDGSITACVVQDDEWRVGVMTDSAIVFTSEAETGMELIRQQKGVIRAVPVRDSKR